jgi:hypothetical protein
VALAPGSLVQGQGEVGPLGDLFKIDPDSFHWITM